MSHVDRWDTVSLDWRWNSVPSKLDILQHNWVKASILEADDMLNALCTLLSDLDLSDAIVM